MINMDFCSKFIILLFSIVFQNVLCRLFEGDLCKIPSTQTNGICKLFSECSSARHAWEQGIFPEVNCGFENSQPIVCCVDNGTLDDVADKRPTGTTVTVSTTTAPPKLTTSRVQVQSTSSPKVGDKSKQNCQEYGRYVYTDDQLLTEKYQVPVDNCVSTIEGPPRPQEYPHMALIGFYGENNTIFWGCSGTLISEKFVLSSAHCTFHTEYFEPRVILLGEVELYSSADNAKPQQIPIKSIIRHPNYRPTSAYHDIALFELEDNAVLNSYIRPACLNTNSSITNARAIATGWDLLSGYTNKNMQKVTLEIITNTECNQIYRNYSRRLNNGIEETQLCAGTQHIEKDICQGDSGGPLQVENTKEVYCTFKIIGITSIQQSCGINRPGIYTRVSAYINWIEDIVWP